MTMNLLRRSWTPDVEAMANQLIADARSDDSFLDSLATFASWEQTAADHGETLTTDDYQSLAILLAGMLVDR